jgi:type III pantothenate kinase
MTPRTLLLDVGNTRLKWALVEHDGAHTHWLDHGAARHDHIEQLFVPAQAADFAASCLGVNVAGDAVNQSIQTRLASLGLQPVWLHAQTAACGVRNRYRPATSLGADRWAALIGARHRTHADCLVVSAGTALTIDALQADGSFIGGVIVPGKQAMRHALARTTAALGERIGSAQHFPDNTDDAVETGLLLAAAGAIAQMYERFARRTQTTPVCLIHGGDADGLIELLPFPILSAPGLILEGVDLLARETSA